MTESILIDTDILIDVARNDEIAIARLEHERSDRVLAISVITQMELIVGCRNKTEIKKLEQFLTGFAIRNLDADTCSEAVELLKNYRLSHGLLIADSLIAATALAGSLPLLSKNQKDYKFIDRLDLIAYP